VVTWYRRTGENGTRGLSRFDRRLAGIHVGTLVHVAAATAGLSALIVASAVAFSVVKYAGAA